MAIMRCTTPPCSPPPAWRPRTHCPAAWRRSLTESHRWKPLPSKATVSWYIQHPLTCHRLHVTATRIISNTGACCTGTAPMMREPGHPDTAYKWHASINVTISTRSLTAFTASCPCIAHHDLRYSSPDEPCSRSNASSMFFFFHTAASFSGTFFMEIYIP